MGILNITPDSFADGGKHLDPADAVAAASQMAAEGADIIDVGGESTRPGAQPLSADEEMRRVLPVIEALASAVPLPVSVDTYKASVASEALRLGASIVNDVSGLQYEPALGAMVADAGAAIVLMHTRGRSREMYDLAVYGDAPHDVAAELAEAVARARRAGVRAESIVVDPGLGFAKRAEHTYEVLAHLDAIASLDRPILSGPSRKSFLKAAIGDRAAADRDWATAAAVTASVLFGAHIVRVHDVTHMVDVVRVADRIRTAAFGGAE
jgi:dihydropteroate synthase